MLAVLRETHILERMSHLVGYGMAHRLTGRRPQPKGTDLEVVAAAIAHPVGGMVQQHHDLIFSNVGILGIHKAQLADLEFIERLALLQQVLLVHLIGRRRLRGFLRAVAIVPEHDDIVGLDTTRLRPRVLVVGIALLVHRSCLPFIRNIYLLLREDTGGHEAQQYQDVHQSFHHSIFNSLIF